MNARLAVGLPVLLGACLAAIFVSLPGVSANASPRVALERLLSLGLAAAAHLLLGYLGTRFAPGRWWAWGALVAAPSLLLLTWNALRDAQSAGLCALYGLVALGGAVGGAWDGARGMRANAA